MALRMQELGYDVQFFDQPTRQDAGIELNLPESCQSIRLLLGKCLLRCLERPLIS